MQYQTTELKNGIHQPFTPYTKSQEGELIEKGSRREQTNGNMMGETAAASFASSIDVQESIKTTILTSSASVRINPSHGSWCEPERVVGIATIELKCIVSGVRSRRKHLGPHTVGSVLAVVSLVVGDVLVVDGLLVVDTLRHDDLGLGAAFDDPTICGIPGCLAGQYIEEDLGGGGPGLATTMLVDLHNGRRLRYVPIALPRVVELVSPSARSTL